jgi:ubiquitin C-terminal hydrolase
LGYTCYLSAALQMLFTVPGFMARLKERGGGKLTRSIVSVSQELADKKKETAVIPRGVKAAMNGKTTKFEALVQHDAHDLLVDLVESVHEELQGKDKKTELGGTNADDNGDVSMSSHETLPTDDFCVRMRLCHECTTCGRSK